MTKILSFLMIILLTGMMLSGCRGNTQPTESSSTGGTTLPSTQTTPTQTTQSTEGTPAGTATTQSAQILNSIWRTYGENERFAAYGGAIENSVTDAPGDLDVQNTEELTTRYLLPESSLQEVIEGASLVHMMNSNIFTGVVFKLSENASAEDLAKDWRDAIQGNQWICGMPDRLLLADVDGQHLLMVFASKDILTTFQDKLTGQYAQARILYNEAVVS